MREMWDLMFATPKTLCGGGRCSLGDGEMKTGCSSIGGVGLAGGRNEMKKRKEKL